MGVPVIVLIFFIALVVGSFLTVASSDPDGFDWLKRKRSKCENCGHTLEARDLFPVVSYLWLKGKCRYCGEKIAPHHVLTEIAAVLLFGAAYFVTPKPLQSGFVFLLAMLVLLLALTLTDLKFWTLPDIFVAFLGLIGVARAIILRQPPILDCLAGAAAGFILLGGIYFFSKGKGMGMGDVKLAAAMGLVLGFGPLLLALMFAFVAGGIVGMIMILLRKATPKSMVPFGPFLTGATALLLLFPALYGQVLLFYGLL